VVAKNKFLPLLEIEPQSTSPEPVALWYDKLIFKLCSPPPLQLVVYETLRDAHVVTRQTKQWCVNGPKAIAYNPDTTVAETIVQNCTYGLLSAPCVPEFHNTGSGAQPAPCSGRTGGNGGDSGSYTLPLSHARFLPWRPVEEHLQTKTWGVKVLPPCANKIKRILYHYNFLTEGVHAPSWLARHHFI
jgi:hypothetical protein